MERSDGPQARRDLFRPWFLLETVKAIALPPFKRIDDSRPVSLGLDFGAESGGELAGKFHIAAGMSERGSADDSRAFFLG